MYWETKEGEANKRISRDRISYKLQSSCDLTHAINSSPTELRQQNEGKLNEGKLNGRSSSGAGLFLHLLSWQDVFLFLILSLGAWVSSHHSEIQEN